MASIILVVGLLESDSGKTTASIPLVRALDLVPFKPRSGHNVWLHYDHTRRCVELGLPVSRDATRLLSAAEVDLPPTLVNPFHRVWTTPDVAKAVESDVSLRYVSSRPDAYVLLDRMGNTVRLYGSDTDLRYLPEETTRMLENCDRIEERAEEPSPEEIYRVIDRAWRRVRREGPALVESLNNLAVPWPGVLRERGVVVAVGPGVALLYDLRDYARAVETLSAGREVVTLNVLEVLEPLEVVRLPPLSRKERVDPRKLEESYGELVAAVRDAL
ncbi:MAG: hypothetical protein ABGY09_04760 [Euryarchaeota archaeon]